MHEKKLMNSWLSQQSATSLAGEIAENKKLYNLYSPRQKIREFVATLPRRGNQTLCLRVFVAKKIRAFVVTPTKHNHLPPSGD